MKKFFVLFLFTLTLLSAQSPETPKVVSITEEGHHHLVFENEYVKVFQVEVPAHSETFYHQHDRDYVFVTLGDSVVENVRLNEPPVKLELKDGETRFTKGGFAHKAMNLSDKAFKNLTVELKNKVMLKENFLSMDPQVLKTGENIQSKPKLLQNMIFSNDWVQATRIIIGPGMQLPIHRHVANCMIVAISDIEVDYVGKKNRQLRLRSGDFQWIDNPGKHIERNVGKTTAEFIVLSLFDRDSDWHDLEIVE